MTKSEVGEGDITGALISPVSLAFRVKAHEDNLFSAEVLLIKGDKVVETRHGPGTTLGHAIAAADDLMDGWAFSAVERAPEEYFNAVFL